MHSHTYCGNPLACSAAIEVLNIMEDEKIIEKANKNSIYFNELIKQTLGDYKFVGDIRNIGLINAIELVKNRETKESFDSKDRIGYQIYKEALKMGVVLRPLGDVIYFNPPLTITREDIDFVVDVCDKSIRKILG